MTFSDIIPPDGVVADLSAGAKKAVLQQLTRRAGDVCGIEPRQLFDAVTERERLGSTGVGQGVAIPHARIAGLDRILGVFARLTTPVDFDAVDDAPVDLVFLLLAPEDAGADHLKALARVSRAFRKEEFRTQLRSAPSSDALQALLIGQSESIDAV